MNPFESGEVALAERLAKVARLWKSVAEKELAHLELSYPRWTALWKLARLGPVTQKQLAVALDIELPSLMRTLEQLEQQQLINRVASPIDRRARIVELTKAGQHCVDELAQRVRAVRKNLLAGIDPEELMRMEMTLAEIEHNALHYLSPS